MIELPPQPGPASSPTNTKPSAEINAAELAKQQVSQNIRALVVETRLRQDTGSNQKPVYDILLKASATLSNLQAAPSNSTAITQVTPSVIQSLQQGQIVTIRTQASFNLTPATQLLASISVNQGVSVQTIIPPTISEPVNAALKQLVPKQQGLTPLFQMLQQLAAAKALTGNAQSQALHSEIKALLRLMPNANQITDKDALQQAVRNSGIFLESKLQQAIKQHLSQTADAGPSAKTESAENKISQTIRDLSQKLLNTSRTNTPDTDASKIHNSVLLKDNLSTQLKTVLHHDMKHALQKLQAGLEKAASASAKEAAEPNSIKSTATPGKTTAAAVNAALNNAPNKNPNHNADAFAKTSEAGRAVEKLADQYRVATTSLPKTQQDSAGAFVPNRDSSLKGPTSHYVATTHTASIEGNKSTTVEPFLLPPLPGQISLQPQARGRAPLKGNEMADALVAVLLKQVKGALSRMTLHQLASQPRASDSAAQQPLLSFEIPFVHNGQVQLFQFLIEEETTTAANEEPNLAKRWVVQMAFDIEGLGPMLCQINLLGKTASVSFWAEWENTLQQTRQHFDELERVLSELGLKVDKLQGHLGIPKSEQTLIQNQLVDIRT